MSALQSILRKIKQNKPEFIGIRDIVSQGGGRGFDTQDYETLSGIIAASQSLRELDLSQWRGSFSYLLNGISENRSMTTLNLEQALYNNDMGSLLGVLRSNPGICELNISNIGFDADMLNKLVVFLKEDQRITHLNLLSNPSSVINVVQALLGSPNILGFSGEQSAALDTVCASNKAVAARLSDKALHRSEELTTLDIQDIRTRLPSLLYVAEHGGLQAKAEIARMFVNIEDVARQAGVEFEIPARYESAAAALPRLFSPAGDKVDFANIAAFDGSVAYQAVRAGQVDDLLQYLRTSGNRLSAQECLFAPEGERENLIQLVSRQSRLPEVLSADLWIGNARDFLIVAQAAPSREWRRQMKDQSLDALVARINAASFKKKHRPQIKFG